MQFYIITDNFLPAFGKTKGRCAPEFAVKVLIKSNSKAISEINLFVQKKYGHYRAVALAANTLLFVQVIAVWSISPNWVWLVLTMTSCIRMRETSYCVGTLTPTSLELPQINHCLSKFSLLNTVGRILSEYTFIFTNKYIWLHETILTDGTIKPLI